MFIWKSECHRQINKITCDSEKNKDMLFLDAIDHVIESPLGKNKMISNHLLSQ